MKRVKWLILGTTVLLAVIALVEINYVSGQMRRAEVEKVKLWANAIAQKARLVNYSEQFFASVARDERRKMELYTNILRSFDRVGEGADADFCLDYVRYIVDSCETALIITNDDSVITVPSELAGERLEGARLKEFSHNKPFHYRIWGMGMTLYYKESRMYTDLRRVLDGFNRSFLEEITNNGVLVPVLVVDSLKTKVLASGNMKKEEFATPQALAQRLGEMEEENDPILLRLPDGQQASVYYENTPMLKALRWVPMLYLFIFAVLLTVSYHLYRTARNMEQNRIWVGMAKETAHQLGTPISSLMAWTQYLEGKRLEPGYATEINKDLRRLETVAHRFSKIGSLPELEYEGVCAAVGNALGYLQTRSSKKVKFVTNFPDEDIRVPLNSYLFEWVIENVCKNAIDAMNGVGTLTTVVSSDSRYVYVDIGDTGRGMSPKVQKRVFDSGFSTKPRGWGLGLSLAKRIVNDYHGGRIFVKYSVEGQGTVFRIMLKR